MLSAAHCFEEPKNCARYSVGLGMHNHDVRDGTEENIHHISIHPNYTTRCGSEVPDFDFSILHFGFKVDLNRKVIPACLPDDSLGGDFLAGKNLTVSGWGAPYPKNLHKATLPGKNNNDCRTYNDDFVNCTYISTNMLCAGNPENRKAAHANADSGGSIQ